MKVFADDLGNYLDKKICKYQPWPALSLYALFRLQAGRKLTMWIFVTDRWFTAEISQVAIL